MTTFNELGDDRSRAARVLVLLQERRLRACVATWRRARDVGVAMPRTDDKDYESLDALLRHVIDASRFYVTWVARKLELPDPEIRTLPEGELTDDAVDAYLEHLEERWRDALRDADPGSMGRESWKAPWGAPFTADTMLEHAVIHPVRHGFQLEEWVEARRA